MSLLPHVLHPLSSCSCPLAFVEVFDDRSHPPKKKESGRIDQQACLRASCVAVAGVHKGKREDATADCEPSLACGRSYCLLLDYLIICTPLISMIL